jgi:pimeloyl-ACP methyl ester carboxylesterase
MADFEERVHVPALMVCAEDDPFLPPMLATGMERYVPDLEKHLIAGCGHWTQQEEPEELNRILSGWLRRRF